MTAPIRVYKVGYGWKWQCRHCQKSQVAPVLAASNAADAGRRHVRAQHPRDLAWFIANAPKPDRDLTAEDFTDEAISRASREALQRSLREDGCP